jgi:platelet-activating factor acetylhydrolase IB subunit alpha
MVLTEKQRADLNAGILDYLKECGTDFADVADAFAAAAKLEGAPPSRPGILEKKWTSVVRLQRKLMDTEAKLATAMEDLKILGKGGLAKGGNGSDAKTAEGLPRAPHSKALSGHRGGVTSIAYHPVFNLLVSASEDSTIKVWDYESGEFERTMKGHTNIVNCVAFNGSGDMLASCSADLTIKLWDFNETFNCTKTLMGHDHNVSAIAFVPSGQHLLSCSRDTTLRVWETRTGYCIRTVHAHEDWVRALAVSGDGTLVATASSDKTVGVWKLDLSSSGGVGGEQAVARLEGHDHVVECVAFLNQKGSSLLNLRKQTTLIDSGSTDVGEGSSKAAASYVATGSRDRTVRVWDVLSATCIMAFKDHENWVRQVQVHPCGKFLFSVAEDRTMRVFDMKDQRCARTLSDAHGHFLTCLAVHPDGNRVATGSVDKSIRVWACR